MKKNVKRLLSVLLAAILLLGLCACSGKGDSPETHFKFGKYEVDYKGASLMETESGIDALVMTYSFTNNSDSAASYGWTVFEKVVQDGAELEWAFVLTNPETFASVSDDYFTEVPPGESLVLCSAYELTGTGKVTVTLSDLLDKNTYTITIDPTTLSKEDASSSAVSSGLDALINKAENDLTGTGETAPAADKPAFLEWWDGDWYGWWIINSGTDYYDGYEGYFWDCCATIETEADLTGYLTLWDEDNDVGCTSPDARVEVSFNSAGVGEHGTMFSESGDFLGGSVGHADWIVDPGLVKADDLLRIDGTYEDADGSFSYEIYLRPWGVLWDDITDDVLDYSDPLPGMYDWYVDLVNDGQPMPEILGSSFNTVSIDLTTPEPAATEAPVEEPSVQEQPAAAVPSGKMIPFSVDGEVNNGTAFTLDFELPEGEWDLEDILFSYNIKFYNWYDANNAPWDTPFIWVLLHDNEEKLNSDAVNYENLSETEGRTISGIEMKGRKYDRFGYEQMQEYYGVLPNGIGVSIRFVKVPDSLLPECHAILDTFNFK